MSHRDESDTSSPFEAAVSNFTRLVISRPHSRALCTRVMKLERSQPAAFNIIARELHLH